MTVEPVTGKQSNGSFETPQPGFKYRTLYALSGLPRRSHLTYLTWCLHFQSSSTSITALVRTKWPVPGTMQRVVAAANDNMY